MPESPMDLEAEVARLRTRVEELERDALGVSLDAFAGQIPDNLIILDRSYRILYINRTVPDLTVEAVLGTSLHVYVPEHVRERSIEAIDRAFATGEIVRLTSEYFAADGSISTWESRMVPLRNAKGEVDRLLQISTNTTERDAATADLARFFQLSVDMLCVATLAGQFKRLSPAFTAALGWSESELCARPFLDFVHPDDKRSTLETVETLRSGLALTDFENRYRTKNGAYRTLEWRAIAEPRTGLIYAAARDVTERRALEENLRHARKMEAIGRLAGGVAHDFNNLILAISLNAELMSRQEVDPEPLEAIRVAAERAAQLTRQLLLFSRKELVKTQTVDLNHVVTTLVHILRRAIATNIRVELQTSPEPLFVRGDPSQLEQVVMNLCLNSRDAMPHGGTLTIATGISPEAADGNASPRGASFARLVVADTGSGIPREIRHRIFDPFFTTKPPGSGTGLGLSTVYGIVEQHQGRVAVDSEPGHGARFDVLLPLTEPGAVPEPLAEEEPVRGGTETLLVAEDSESVRRAVVTLLEGAGYRIVTAAHGDEALARVRERGDEIALALLDVIMPYKTGPEVAAIVSKTHPALKILFTSGYADAPPILERIPEDRLLRKPYGRNDLLRRVRRALDERSTLPRGPSVR